MTEGLTNDIPNTQMGERNGEVLSMLKPNEVTGGLTNDIPNTQMGERNGEDLSMLKPNEVTEGLTNDKDEKSHEDWNKKQDERKRREKRIALFENGKRRNMSSNSNRQDSWAKWQSATNLMVREKKREQTTRITKR